MSMYWDKKKDTRLISFLYNSIFFTGVSLNNNLELTFNPSLNNSLPLIDNRINLTGLDGMSNAIENIIKTSITNLINRQPPLQVGILSVVIGNILSMKIPAGTPIAESNLSDILVKELSNYFYRNTLKDDDFNWISISSPRVVDFVWSSLRNSYFHLTKNNIIINSELDYRYANKMPDAYQAMNLEKNPPDLKSKIASIKLFFDSWGEPFSNQEQLMKLIKSKWEYIKNRSEIIDWLNKNEELTTWAWSYIVESMLNKSIPVWVNISSSETKEIEQQTKNTIITLYDLLDRETDKKLLKSQLSKNGTQQKYRLKEKINTRVLNLNVSIEAKNNLEKLKKIKNKSMKEIIEDLINEELDRVSSCR